MSDDDKRWIEQALDKCESASRKSCAILFIRDKADSDDSEGSIVITNSTDAVLVGELRRALQEEIPEGD